jgi:hypothetical protein
MANSKGFCIVAQNNSVTNYVRQAYALASSIHKFNKNQKISIITNDAVPQKYQSVFDKIISIPEDDLAEKSEWKIDNRWKVYDASPYDETIVMDADMLVLEDITRYWNYFSTENICFTTDVKTYRNSLVKSRYYRKTFDTNNLLNIYSAFYYFKKGPYTENFFKILKLVMTNWKEFYQNITPHDTQKWASVDVSIAIVCKILGHKNKTVPTVVTHMKPYCQNWQYVPDKCVKVLDSFIDNDGSITIENFLQTGILHYVDDEFLTEDIINGLSK